MTLDDAIQTWQAQPEPKQDLDQIDQLIRRKNLQLNRQVYVSLAFTLLCLVCGILNFYGQYFVNEDPLLVSFLRSLPVLVVLPIQATVFRRLRRTQREQLSLVADQAAWLRLKIADLQSELRGVDRWKFIAFAIFILVVVTATKWLDFRSGQDTLAECFGIVVFVVLLFAAIGIGMWHHRVRFVAPELKWFQQTLAEMESAN